MDAINLQLQDIQDVRYTDNATFEVTKNDGSKVLVSKENNEKAFDEALQFAVNRENAQGHNISETSRNLTDQ